MKKIFKIAIITALSVAIFFTVSYAYLDYSMNKSVKNTDKKDYTVPYVSVPESSGIAFVYPNNSATLAYLDFDEENIRLLNIENFDPECPEYYGYTVDYTVTTNYELISGIIDRVGGIEIEQNNETMRYTGVQVIEIISDGYDKDTKKQIISQVFYQISNGGFSSDDFLYIIENCKSNLSFTECIYWLDYIEEMSKNVAFVN